MLPDGSDDRLLIDFSSGSEEAFEKLYERHYPLVLRTSHRLLGSQDAAEDIAQDVFVRLYRYPRIYRPGKARFTTWLYRVTVNACIDHIRKSSRRTRAEESGVSGAAPSGDPQHQALAEEQAAAVRAAVLSLPPKQRTALVLQRYEGLSYSEVAQVMRTSASSVESLLSRARETLRLRLGGPKTSIKERSR